MPSIVGVVGQVKWAYYMAAALDGYRVTYRRPPGDPRAPGTWTLEGRVIASDAFKLAQRPLTFVAPHARGEWAWPIETITIRDGRLTARLGAPGGRGIGGTTPFRATGDGADRFVG